MTFVVLCFHLCELASRGENEFIHMAIELETMDGCEKGSPGAWKIISGIVSG